MRFTGFAAIVAAFVVSVTPSMADKYDVKSFTMKVDGTSTLHDWTTPVTRVRAKGDMTVVGTEIKSVNAMWVQADAKSITSEKGEDMEEKIYETLEAEKNPTITFNMTSMKAIRKEGNDYVIEAVGDLTIAGTTKKVELKVKGVAQASGDVQLSGSTNISLANFGMERPSAMLGMIKAGDMVTVSFTVTMKKS